MFVWEGVFGVYFVEWYGIMFVLIDVLLWDLIVMGVCVLLLKMEFYEECGFNWVVFVFGGDIVMFLIVGIGIIVYEVMEWVLDGDIECMWEIVVECWFEFDFEIEWIGCKE